MRFLTKFVFPSLAFLWQVLDIVKHHLLSKQNYNNRIISSEVVESYMLLDSKKLHVISTIVIVWFGTIMYKKVTENSKEFKQ